MTAKHDFCLSSCSKTVFYHTSNTPVKRPFLPVLTPPPESPFKNLIVCPHSPATLHATLRHSTLSHALCTYTSHSRHFASLPRLPLRSEKVAGFSEKVAGFNARVSKMPLSPSHSPALEPQTPPHAPATAEVEQDWDVLSNAHAGIIPETEQDWDLLSNADTEPCEELQREQIRDEISLNGGYPTDEHLQRLGHLRHARARLGTTAQPWETSLPQPLVSVFAPDELSSKLHSAF